MIDIESPPTVRATRTSHQEKKLRKRRELDALVKDVGGGRKRRRVGANEELLSKEDSSSDSGEGRIHDGVEEWWEHSVVVSGYGHNICPCHHHSLAPCQHQV